MSYKTRPLPAGTPEKNDRVAHLRKIMANGEYYGINTCMELSELWGISINTVKDDASEAGRMLKVSPEEVKARKTEMAAWFLNLGKTALRERSKVTNLPDYKAAAEAMRLYGIYSGIADKVAEEQGTKVFAPMKIEIVMAEPEAKKEEEPK